MKVTELRQRLHEFAVTYRVDTVDTRKEDLDRICQIFATFLEELELPEKGNWEDWALDSDVAYISGKNHGIDQTRTLIQAQVKELRKI